VTVALDCGGRLAGLPLGGSFLYTASDAAADDRGCRRATRWANPRWATPESPQKVGKRRFLMKGSELLVRARDNILGGIVKITALIVVLLALAVGTGAAMVASVHKEPVLLACGGPNC
jgi:hypothetical protein